MFTKFDIIVHPTVSEPKPVTAEPKPKLGRKWRFPWRINMLARPKPPVAQKYAPPPPEVFKIFGELDPITEFRADHLSRPMLRMLVKNKELLKDTNPKCVKNLVKTIHKAWDSIYNHYKKQLRQKRLKRLKRKLERLKAKKPKGKSLEKILQIRAEHLNKMATPKKVFLPEKIPKKWKPLEDLARVIDVLSQPKEYHIVPPREIGKVSSRALVYEPTETVIRLAKVPEWRMKRPPEPESLAGVKRSALTATCTPRIDKLAQPSFSMREAKKHDEDKYDPWIISPNALKYKPSPRILELAKPMERD